jgi:hypothetical protein
VFLLSVVVAVLVAMFGLFGFPSGDLTGGRQVEARVITAWPCGRAEGMEVVRFTMDGRDWEAQFVAVTAFPGGSEQVVHAADATGGQGRYGRRLGGLLLVLSGMAGAGYTLLVRRGPRGTPMPVIGPFNLEELRRGIISAAGLIRRRIPGRQR